MDSRTFESRLQEVARHTVRLARDCVLQRLPDEVAFRIYPNQSFDGHPRVGDEVVFPEESLPDGDFLGPWSAQEAVTQLLRDERIPEWIDASVEAEDGRRTLVGLRCCGRYTASEELLYLRPVFEFELNPKAVPKRIDLLMVGGRLEGIYKLDDDKLTLCYPWDLEEMPTAVHGIPHAYPCEYEIDVHHTSYLMLVGEHAFGHPNRSRTASEIVDGHESTIAVVETMRKDVHWLAPNDLNVDTMSFVVNDGPGSVSSRHPRGPAVLFCDGAVYRLSPTIDPDTLQALTTIDGREDISRDRLVDQGYLVDP